jgi:L-fuconolactonase
MATITTVDTHLHVWDLARLPYHWLTPDNPLLYRNYLPDEVYPQMQAAGIDAAVLVEAANLTAEIPWLTGLTNSYPWIVGVVGWMSEDDQLTAKPHPALRAARIPALSLGETVALPQAVRTYGLTCDLMLTPDAYYEAETVIRAWPDTHFVLEHFAGTWITPGGYLTWGERLRPLAALPNASMKISGALTSADPKPLAANVLRTYIDTAVELFGADRLMYGSNWPVCTSAGSYEQDVDLVRRSIRHLDSADQSHIMGLTAIRVYNLPHAIET